MKAYAIVLISIVGLSVIAAMTSAASLPFWKDVQDVIYSTNAGGVGIGTQTPQAKLDVNGSAVVQGDLYVFGRLRTDSIRAVTNVVKGCDKSACKYNISFDPAYNYFTFPPTVTCSAGKNANSNWGPIICMIDHVTVDHVGILLDSSNANQKISGNKNVYIIAIDPLAY